MFLASKKLQVKLINSNSNDINIGWHAFFHTQIHTKPTAKSYTPYVSVRVNILKYFLLFSIPPLALFCVRWMPTNLLFYIWYNFWQVILWLSFPARAVYFLFDSGDFKWLDVFDIKKKNFVYEQMISLFVSAKASNLSH